MSVGMGTKKYLVECEECGFSHTVAGYEDAISAAENHSKKADHHVTAIELPKNLT